MAKAIRVMTFNLQQLPWLARRIQDAPIVGTPGGAPAPDPVARARTAARAILDLPLREQPDVVVFNEAFSEDARPVLVRILRGKYPNIIPKFDHPGFDEDSGLMVFSKLPFEALPAGGNHVFKVYKESAGSDARASKGVGVVRVMGPVDPTTIAFTHLQASYDAANTENSGIRLEQLKTLVQVVTEVAGNNMGEFSNTVIVGDFNIKGDPDDTTGERNTVFSNAPGGLGESFVDAWRASMHPPGDMTDYDPGYTQRDTPTLQRNRFDFQCTRRGAAADVGLVAQHMRIPIRMQSEISDHWALVAHIHRASAHGSPSMAVDMLALDPINKGMPESSVWQLQAQMQDEDMFHWVYIAEQGTFSVFTSASIEVHGFRRSDFTNELMAIDTLSSTELPESLQLLLNKRDSEIQTRGQVFSCREPFYLRVRGVSTSFKGSAPFRVVRHAGETKETAILLHAHLDVDPGMPEKKKLGAKDECWLRAQQPTTYSGNAYIDHFVLKNRAGVTCGLEQRVPVPASPQSVSGQDPELDLAVTGEPADLFLVLTRSSTADVHFLVRWNSPLCFVRLDESFRLHVADETGPDWPGDDEFDLDIFIDGDNVFSDSWDDAEAGRDWPGLAPKVSASVLARTGQGLWAAFASDVTFSALKTDGVSAHSTSVGLIAALDDTDKDTETRSAAITVVDPLGDGHLLATAMLSKFPPV